MRRAVLPSTAFIRAARRLLKKKPEAAPMIAAALDALSEDAFQPAMKTHKLKGDLKGSWACSLGYDLRIVFQIVAQGDSEAILLQTIGTHDEVY